MAQTLLHSWLDVVDCPTAQNLRIKLPCDEALMAEEKHAILGYHL